MNDHDFASIILYIANTDIENMTNPTDKRPYFSFLLEALYALSIPTPLQNQKSMWKHQL